MFLKTEIDSICILGKNISVKLTSSDIRHDIFETIKKIKRVSHHFRFEQYKEPKLSVDGIITSVNLRKQIHIVLHIPTEKTSEIIPIISPLVEIKDAPVYLIFEPPQKNNNIDELLNEVSQTYNKSPEDLLFELSSFNKKGIKIDGKRNIEKLSDKQKEVIKDKLLKIIHQSKNRNSHR